MLPRGIGALAIQPDQKVFPGQLRGQDEFGRVPTEEEIDRMFHLTRVMWKAVLGRYYKRKEQKKSGPLAIF